MTLRVKYPLKNPKQLSEEVRKMIENKIPKEGVMKVIKMFGEVEEGVSLKDLKTQAGNIAEFDSLVMEIASPGGSVQEGLEIMVWLDYLSSQGKYIVTVVTANAYSIASLFMLSANMRCISKHGKVMVHNPMVPELSYVNANELEEYLVSLRDLEGVMYELYEVFTGLKKEEIKNLMDNETYLSPQDAVKMGFADVVVDIKPKSYEMTRNIKQEINMSKTLNILNRVIGMVGKSEFINQVYGTESGEEIEVFQTDASVYKIGDKTSMEKGEVVFADGAKVTIKDFVITDINRGVEVKDEVVPEMAPDMVPEVAPEVAPDMVPELTPEGEAVVTAMEPEVVPHVAPHVAPEVVPHVVPEVAPEVVPGKGKNDMPSSVIETTESIITTKETVAMEVEAEAIVEVEAEAKVEAEAAFNEGPAPKEMIAALVARVESLEAKYMDVEAKFEARADFESVAATAIDTLAGNAVSNFKPEAKRTSEAVIKGSIFNQLKQKAGLK